MITKKLLLTLSLVASCLYSMENQSTISILQEIRSKVIDHDFNIIKNDYRRITDCLEKLSPDLCRDKNRLLYFKNKLNADLAIFEEALSQENGKYIIVSEYGKALVFIYDSIFSFLRSESETLSAAKYSLDDFSDLHKHSLDLISHISQPKYYDNTAEFIYKVALFFSNRQNIQDTNAVEHTTQ